MTLSGRLQKIIVPKCWNVNLYSSTLLFDNKWPTDTKPELFILQQRMLTVLMILKNYFKFESYDAFSNKSVTIFTLWNDVQLYLTIISQKMTFLAARDFFHYRNLLRFRFSYLRKKTFFIRLILKLIAEIYRHIFLALAGILFYPHYVNRSYRLSITVLNN